MISPEGVWTLLAATRQRTREQWYAPERLRALRLRRLRRLAEIAASTPWYAEVFRRAGLAPADFGSEEALRRLPLLERATLRERGRDAMLTLPAAGLSVLATSGSTGEPLRFFRSSRDQAEVSALWARLWRAYGRRPLDRQVNIGSGQARIKEGPVAALRRLGLLPALHQIASFDPMDRQIAALRRARPHIISGYSVALELVAEAVISAGVRDIRPRVVMSGAMVITDRCRALCREAFGVAPLDVYATVECGPVGWECPVSGTLHLDDDVQIVEIVDDAGRPVPLGGLGNVVVTQLICTAQPLIRYHTGDVAARLPGRCACGRGLGLLAPVEGRARHVIRSANGRVITSANIGGVVRVAPQVRRFQVRQTGVEDLRILLVTEGAWTPEAEEAIRRALRERVGEGFRCEFELVRDIPLGPGGKFQAIVPLED
jgi:phenylacetate-CoA ligase